MSRLIVIVPGLGRDLARWQPLIDRLKTETALKDSQWLPLDHGVSFLSCGDPHTIGRDIRARIDQEWAARGPYEEVILVGHSAGGVFIRDAYLLACGVEADTPGSEWAGRVSRIILFAAVNRGVDPARSSLIGLLSWAGRVFPPMQRFLNWHLLQGSAFITNLRILWIRHFASLGDSAPVVVQLLGTKDSIVRRSDSVDVEQFRNAYHIEIPQATHGDLHRLDDVEDPDGRYALLRDAFVHTRPQHAENLEISGPERVVFVLHGIRADNRTWVDDTVAFIRAKWPDIEVIGMRYTYISALKFAIPSRRRKKLRWFQDAYSEQLARNPRATFSFIGHSNGTFLFGESLRRIPAMKFDRAVLVGSVLPEDYDWGACARNRQVNSLRIDGSCYDWPVGWLCSALRGIGMRDIGTGGYVGFTDLAIPKKEFFWYGGGHSAPLSAANLANLAEFVVTGNAVAPAGIGAEVSWFSMISRALRILAPIIVLALLVSLCYLFWVKPFAGLLLVLGLMVVVFILDIF